MSVASSVGQHKKTMYSWDQATGEISALTEREEKDAAEIDARLAALMPTCDFKGVKFCDISPLLADFVEFDRACATLAAAFYDAKIDVVAGIEARGFIFGPQIAQYLDVGFVQMRKPGKLPGETLTLSYKKEYGTDTLEIQRSAIGAGKRVLIVDDILATGGTLVAACQLIELAGGVPAGCAMVAQLVGLGGRELLCERTRVERIATLVDLDFSE